MEQTGPRAGVIVTAAGSGQRFGSFKQFEKFAGQTVLSRAVVAAAAVASELVVVVPAGEEVRVRSDLAGLALPIPVSIVVGGATRARSVRAGVEALNPDLPLVAIHDGVRPMASPALFRRVLVAAAETGAAIPALACADTVKRVEGGRITGTVDRSSLRLAQTPQAFRTDWLRDAYRTLGDRAFEMTDEAGLCEAMGHPVAVVEGEADNVKVTQPADLERLAARFGGVRLPRVGMGYDVHPFAVGRRLILGGVEFPGDGLAGHSDADVVAHAIADAVLGAAGLGDIGRHFPDTDPTYRGADSLTLLKAAVAKARDAGLVVGNVDLTIAANHPKIAPQAALMRERLSAALGISAALVNVKATTGEGLGFVGRAEGISVTAVALLWTI